MQSGQLLCNRYLIEQHLAGGGFGQTYLATDTHLPSKPQVVVKLLKPINNNPATLQIAQRLFNTEAQTLEQLGRDNDRIPSLYAYFELGDEFYVVQEFIEGTTLTDELNTRKLSESDTLAILQGILTGLSRVHSQNIIHRDLKPDNIIRRARDRKLVLIDFGAVKQVRAATVTTQHPVASRTIGIGTEGYMPSEQGLGYPKPASDIYAVGAIGIQCLTGSAPDRLFNEDSLSIEWQHLCQVDRDFVRVLNKMIEPDYRQRYVNATDALTEIESLISPSILPPVQPPSIQPVQSPIQQVNNSPTVPVQLPINKRVQQPLKIDRRKFMWLGYGGLGMVSVWVLSQFGKNSSSNNPVTTNNSPAVDDSIPRLQTIPAKIQLLDAGAEPRRELKFRPVANTKQTMTMTTSMKMMPSFQTDISKVVTKIDLTVVKIEPSGDINYTFSYGDIKEIGDRNTPPQLLAEFQKSVKNLKEMPDIGVISSSGQVKIVSAELPTPLMTPILSALNNFKKLQFFTQLPLEQVGLGAKWQTINSPLTTATYEIVELNERGMTIKLKITERTDLNFSVPKEVKASFNGEGRYVVVFDSLLPVSGQVSTTMSIHHSQNTAINQTTKTVIEFNTNAK